MPEWMLQFGNWLQNSAFGLWVSGTEWYPWIQMIHFAGLSLWVGTIAVLDLRLLGLVGRGHTVSQLAEQLAPLTWTGLGIAVTGGLFLFSGIAATYLQNPAFLTKIPVVLAGIAYHVFVLRRMPGWDQAASLPPTARLAGLVEFSLWVYVVFEAAEIPQY